MTSGFGNPLYCTSKDSVLGLHVLAPSHAIPGLVSSSSAGRVFGKEFRRRSFRRCLPCVRRYFASCLRNRKKECPKELLHKTPFQKRFPKLSKHLEKEHDKRSLHKVAGPCSQARNCLLAEPKSTGENSKIQKTAIEIADFCPVSGKCKLESVSVHPVHGNPLNGPSKNLLGTRQGS